MSDVVSGEELKKLIDSNGEYVLIDVREPEELEMGKIPTSVNIPLDDLYDALEMSGEEFIDKYGIPKPDEGENMIYYCMTGNRSGIARQLSVTKGYLKSKNYMGSMVEWMSLYGV